MTAGASRYPQLSEATRLELKALAQEIDARRLQIFRKHLSRTIRLASPLLIDATTPAELDEAVRQLRPSRAWPAGSDIRKMVRGWHRIGVRRKGERLFNFDKLIDRAFGSGDRLAIIVGRRGMHMAWEAGGTSITTHDRGGALLLPHALGEDERKDLIGSSLDEVFSHPLTIDRPYAITQILPPVGSRATIVEFSAAPEEWRVSWCRTTPF